MNTLLGEFAGKQARKSRIPDAESGARFPLKNAGK